MTRITFAHSSAPHILAIDDLQPKEVNHELESMPRERGKKGSLFSFTTLVLGVIYFLWQNSNHERDKKAKKHSAKWRAEEAKRT